MCSGMKNNSKLKPAVYPRVRDNDIPARLPSKSGAGGEGIAREWGFYTPKDSKTLSSTNDNAAGRFSRDDRSDQTVVNCTLLREGEREPSVDLWMRETFV